MYSKCKNLSDFQALKYTLFVCLNEIYFNNMMERKGYKQNLLEGLFYDNPSILKFWHAVTFLSQRYLALYSELEINKNRE